MLFILVVLWVHISVGLVQKEIKLNAEIPSQDGASIIHNPLNVRISGSHYSIKVHSDDGYDVQLSLDDSWSFEQDIESEITFTFNGYTPDPSVDTDLLLVFSVADWQYFSFFIHLDSTNKIRSRIYSAMSSPYITRSVSDWISDPTIRSRWDRISNNDQWQLLYDWNKQALWPLKFVITNDPRKDQTIFEFYHHTTETYATGYVFNHFFVANQPIDVYILGDSLGERYNISSIDIELNEMDDDEAIFTTLHPSTLPTNPPSVPPTHDPTYNPTIAPTNKPTLVPTIAPTFSTSAPTLSPSHTPTTEPTIITTLSTHTEYGIEMIITFKYTFSMLEISEIMIILHELTNTMQESQCNEWNHDVLAQDHNRTVITATILICDESTQNQLLLEVNNGHLQSDILQSISTQTGLLVLANRTSIRADRIPLDNFSVKTTEIRSVIPPWHLERHQQSMDYYLLLTIIGIALPIVSCCFCTSYFKMKSNKTASTKAKRNKRQMRIRKQIGLSIQAHAATNVLSMSHIPDSDDDDAMTPPRKVRSPSSKSYHYNVRKCSIEANSAKIDNASYPMSPGSVMIGPRDYRTRGISDDIYDQNSDERITKGMSMNEDEDGYYAEEGSGSSDRHCGAKLSAESGVNANSYPQESNVTESQSTSTSSPKYELPKYKVTKRQWL